jgi:AAA+ superfamily predicted ATPase
MHYGSVGCVSVNFKSENEGLGRGRREKFSRLSFLTKIVPKHEWSDLVLPAENVRRLKEISNFVRKSKALKARVPTQQFGRGLAVLFAGEYDIGKTVAVEIFSRDLGLEAYRIDLSKVVSKYIGETEKNLDRIFAAAEESDAILFFDEADALFGKRSEVKDSHDRYANLAINYLLRKIEGQSRVVVIAANDRRSFDDAFLRRLNFVVDFPSPSKNPSSKEGQDTVLEKKPMGLFPGVYVEEVEVGEKPIEGMSTDVVGFLGEAERGPILPKLITSWVEYQKGVWWFFWRG